MGMQVTSPMPIVLETPSRIVLRHNFKASFFVGVGFAAAAIAAVTLIPSKVRFLFGAGFGFFALLVGLFTLWRDQLEIDLGTRQWRRRYGFVGSVQETRGGIDEIPEVVLDLQRIAASEDNAASWHVSIKAPRWKSAIVLEAHAQEETGYAALEKWAKKLRRDAVDRSGQVEVRTAWDALDRPVRERLREGGVAAETAAVPDALVAAFGAPARVSAQPPAGSRILVTRESGRTRIALPPIGWNAGATFVSLFGAVFAGFGTLAALAGAHVITGVMVNGRMLSRPDWGFTALGCFFAAIGFAIIAAMIVGSRAREVVEDARDSIVFAIAAGGLTWSEKRLSKRAIEGVDLSAAAVLDPDASAHRTAPPAAPIAPTDVRVRTDARVVRIGRYLPEADQRWLRDLLEGWTQAS